MSILTKEEVQVLYDERKNFDILSVYTDGKPDIAKIVEQGAGWLIKTIANDKDGKVVEVTLHNDYVGFVYLIKAANGLVKIGRTRDIDKRLSTLQAASPVRLRLLCSKFVRDSKELEKQLHLEFRENRSHGEWFDLDDSRLKKASGIIQSAE